MAGLRAVLFDLDGTLIDHFRTIQLCLSLAARQAGLREPTLSEVRAAVGGGISNTIRTLFGAEAARVEALYPAVWEAHQLEDIEVLPGADEALAALQEDGLALGMFTNKEGRASRRIADHLGWGDRFSLVLGAGDTPWRKPDSRFSARALDTLGVRADECVLVGDSHYDAEAAQAAGMRFMGVTTGTHAAEVLRRCGACEVHPGLAEVAASLLGARRARACGT